MDVLADPWLPFLALSILFAYAVQTMTGFGSQVIVLSLSAIVYPLSVTTPVILALNMLMCGWVSWRLRDRIEFKLLLGEVLPWMGVGVVAGLGVSWQFGVTPPKWPFGVMVVAFALRELWYLRMQRAAGAVGTAARRGWLIGGGVVHGLYASGGPLVVTGLANTGLDRDRFRATLMAMWLVFNGAVLASLVARGGWDSGATWRSLVMLPTVPGGIWIGEHLKNRVDDRTFRAVVQVTLLVAGLALLA